MEPSFYAIITSVLAGAFALHTYIVGRRDKDIIDRQDAKLKECAVEIRDLSDRLHVEEKSTIRQDGEIKLVHQSHSDVRKDIDEVKQTLQTILAELRRRPPASGGYSQVSPPRTEPR
jgi:hypothetical protein